MQQCRVARRLRIARQGSLIFCTLMYSMYISISIIYVYVYIYIYVYLYVRIYVYNLVPTYLSIYQSIYQSTYLSIYLRILVWFYIRICMYVYMYTSCLHIHIKHIYIYIYIYMRMRTPLPPRCRDIATNPPTFRLLVYDPVLKFRKENICMTAAAFIFNSLRLSMQILREINDETFCVNTRRSMWAGVLTRKIASCVVSDQSPSNTYE